MSTIIREPIGCDFEYIQYNKKLRIIHSIVDDMYQVKSIIEACQSDKLSKDWYRNQETKELLNAFRHDRDLAGMEPCIIRSDVRVDLRGYYVHRLLVNDVARWASKTYALQIYKLLDEMATAERKEMESTIQHQRPRMVPINHEHDYKYLIWKESIPNKPNGVILHLVRRSNSSFEKIRQHYDNEDERWFYRDDLPISMSVNKDIKEIIKQIVPTGDYEINNCDVILHSKYLNRLYKSISEYFNQFQK